MEKSWADILEDLKLPPNPLKPLVEQFLYAQTITMIAADPGVGKTTIINELAVSLTGNPLLWDRLIIPRPLRVYYVQLESPYEDFKEQVRLMQGARQMGTEAICWDDAEGLNLIDPISLRAFVKRLEAWGPIDVLILDPAYLSLHGAISKDEDAAKYAKALVWLKKHFGCAIILMHHTRRDQHDQNGKKVKREQNFFGSRWLDAVMDTIYYLTKPDKQHKGVRLEADKDRRKTCLGSFTLNYRAESMTCSIQEDIVGDKLVDRLIAYLLACKQQRKDTDFYQVKDTLGCSDVQLRRLKNLPEIQQVVSFETPTGKRMVWKVR